MAVDDCELGQQLLTVASGAWEFFSKEFLDYGVQHWSPEQHLQ